ncbi:MAG: ketoacyl-ACP synthase III [Treponema sp.]|nr:ketoacyl-ACP synthase III [Treponema sp.]
MAIEVIATGRAIPPRLLTNDELAKDVDTNDEWIRSHTGIGARHVAASEVAASDLAAEAARNALAMMIGVDADSGAAADAAIAEAALSLDVIIVATATPDHLVIPSTACLVQNKLGAWRASAMDISAGCTGFIYGLETAAGLLSVRGGNRRRVLLIGAETLTRFVDWSDRSTCVLFGDGAGAVIVEKTDAPQEGAGKRGLLRSILRADGAGSVHLVCRRGAGRSPFMPGEVVEKSPYIEMNGQAVYNFAVKVITETIPEIAAMEGISLDDVARIIPHQANARIIQAATKRLKLPEDKFFLNIQNYANTSAASIPIALDELNRGGKLSKGDILITMGFGGGLTYGANLLVW